MIREDKEEPEDILGDIYHSLRLNNEWNGQFFTPDHVARLMAKLSNPVSESDSDEGYVTINEPTCGSGTMVIACIWEMKKRGFDYRNKAFFVAQDIDIRCVWMAYIEIAQKMNCSVKYVYDQKYLALQKLRKSLGGEADDQK